MSDAALILGAIFLLLLGNGFFSGSEIALISARKAGDALLQIASSHSPDFHFDRMVTAIVPEGNRFA